MLLLDCGNSTCKWVWDLQSTTENILSHQWWDRNFQVADDFLFWNQNSRFSYSMREMHRLKQVLLSLRSQLPSDLTQTKRVRAVAVCTQERRLLVENVLMEAGWTDIQWCFPSPTHRQSFTNLYQPPERLGVDRFLASYAAWQRYSEQRVLVVNMGTATTIDLVDEKSCFTGGLILPGMGTMLRSLEKRTALLGRQQFRNIATIERFLVPKTTQDAMGQAILRAQFQTILSVKKDWNAQLCVLTGGWVDMLLKTFDQDGVLYRHHPFLIFEGLRTWE
jgi:pantothenate kinase type III